MPDPQSPTPSNSDPYADHVESVPGPPRMFEVRAEPAPVVASDKQVADEVKRKSPEAEPAAPRWTRSKTALTVALVFGALGIVAALAGIFIGWAVAAIALVMGILLIAINTQFWASAVRGKEDEEATANVARRKNYRSADR